MFAYDARTNTLSLQPGRHPPWIRKTSEQERTRSRETSAKTWCYCSDCKGRWCPDKNQRPKAYLPFRDRASQLNMRSHRPQQTGGACPSSANPGTCVDNTQPEFQPEGEGGVDTFAGDVEMPMEEDVDPEVPPLLPMEEPIPDVPKPAAHPKLEDYRARWAGKLHACAKPAGGGYCSWNLVPKPIPNLWQDCTTLSDNAESCSVPEFSMCPCNHPNNTTPSHRGPYVPFDDLKSEEAQARLSACRPASAFEHPTFREGVPRYSPLGTIPMRDTGRRASCFCKQRFARSSLLQYPRSSI